MSIHLSQLARILEEKVQDANLEIAHAREMISKQSDRVSELMKDRMDAFMELAHHYLPGLTHQSITNTWAEVRQQIRDVMLRKEDKRRNLESAIDAARIDIADLQGLLKTKQQELEDAKTVLACKSGNVRKILRDDPAIARRMQQVTKLDVQIEKALAQLDLANEEAKKKLPDYERSSLFSYLLEQKFGTPEYQGEGMQRRWDRWVAKMIDYKKAKASYDYLTQTPLQLKKLIDEKQDQYRAVLKAMRDKKREANKQHGVKAQSEIWKAICDEIERLEDQIEERRWEIVQHDDDLDDLESVTGDYYQEAIEIFQAFLQTLEPETLRVYSECTESPVDDQICARLRHVQETINEENAASAQHFGKVAELLKWTSLLNETSIRMRTYRLQSPYNQYLPETFDFESLLEHIRDQDLSANDGWRYIRKAMVSSWNEKKKVERFPAELYENVHDMLPMDVWFAAASEFARKGPTGSAIDLSSVLMMEPPEDEDTGQKTGFETLAVCQSRPEAKAVMRILKKASISCFMHTHSTNPSEPEAGDMIDVVVARSEFAQAYRLILDEQNRLEKPWVCKCGSRVRRGFNKCWHCGRSH